MPSAFAMFASVPPVPAGTPAAAPNGQDGEAANLFSSQLADVFQGLAKTEAAPTDTPHRAPGRLSILKISAADLGAAEAASVPVEKVEVDTIQPLLIDTPTPDADAQTDPADPAVVELSQDVPVQAAPQPISLVPAVTPSTVAEPSSAASTEVATKGSTDTGLMVLNVAEANDTRPVAPSINEVVSQIPVEADIKPAKPDRTPPSIETKAEADPTAATSVKVLGSEDGVKSLPTKPTTDPTTPVPQTANAAPSPATAMGQGSSVATNKVVAPAPAGNSTSQSTSPATTVADAAEASVEPTATPKVEIKVAVQPAVVTAQPVQIAAAANLKLAVSEAIKAIDVEKESAAETVSDALPTSDLGSEAGAATTPRSDLAPAKPATLSLQQHPVLPRSTQTDAARPAQNGSQSTPTDHVAMADAAPPPGRTAADAASVQTGPAPIGIVATADAAFLVSDPAAPVDAPAETRALDAATTTTQATSASSLSRATIETTAHLAAQIARKLEGRSTRFDMVLTPEDLGRVDVSLEIGSDGQLAARLAFDNPAAAADLRGRADELRRQLQEAGFQVSSDSLDFTQRDTSSGGGFDRQQQQRQTSFAGASRLIDQADLSVTPPPGAWTNHSQTRDRVDVRV